MQISSGKHTKNIQLQRLTVLLQVQEDGSQGASLGCQDSAVATLWKLEKLYQPLGTSKNIAIYMYIFICIYIYILHQVDVKMSFWSFCCLNC